MRPSEVKQQSVSTPTTVDQSNASHRPGEGWPSGRLAPAQALVDWANFRVVSTAKTTVMPTAHPAATHASDPAS